MLYIILTYLLIFITVSLFLFISAPAGFEDDNGFHKIKIDK